MLSIALGLGLLFPVVPLNAAKVAKKPGAKPSSKKADVVEKVKTALTNFSQTLKKGINSADYNMPAIKFTTTIALGDQEVPEGQELTEDQRAALKGKTLDVGLVYDFGFVGSGMEDAEVSVPDPLTGLREMKTISALPLEVGFPVINATLVPEKIPGPVPVPTRTVFNLVLGVSPPLKELFDSLFRVRGDTVWLLKTIFLLNTVRINKENKWPSAKDKVSYIGTELLFLMARLAYTIDEDATRVLQGKGPKDPIDPKGKVAYFTSPAKFIQRLLKKLKIDAILDPKNPDAIKVDMPEIDYWHFVLRANQPPSQIETVLADIFLEKGFDAQTQALAKIIPLITDKMDFFDRKLLVEALRAHGKKIKKGTGGLDPVEVAKARLDGVDGKPGFKKILTDIITKMQQTKVFGEGKPGLAGVKQPEQPDLVALAQQILTDIAAKLVEKEPEPAGEAEKKATEELPVPDPIPVKSERVYLHVPLVTAIDQKWSLLQAIMNYQFTGDKNYIYKGYLPLSYNDMFKVSLALGFRMLRDMLIATRLYVKTPEGVEKYKELVEPKKQAVMAARVPYQEALNAYTKSKTPANKQAMLTVRKAVQDANKAYAKSQLSFRKEVLSFKYNRIAGAEPESIMDFVRRELVGMFRRTKHFSVFEGAINKFIGPLGISLDDMTAGVKDEAEVAAEAELGDLENDLGMLGFEPPTFDQPGAESDTKEAPAGAVSDEGESDDVSSYDIGEPDFGAAFEIEAAA